MTQPAFYARPGTKTGDLVAILHLPYTAWHLSYVVMGAALAPLVDATVLAGTLLAFLLGLGVGAHALDELHDRPLGTALSDRTLNLLGWGGLAAAGGTAVAGAFVVSPLVVVWACSGLVLAAAYALEWSSAVRSPLGFGLAWGSFPVLVGYWAQTESVSVGSVVLAAGALVLSMVQRRLSTPARQIRRHDADIGVTVSGESWSRSDLLATWETPLRLLAAAHVLLAVALLLS